MVAPVISATGTGEHKQYVSSLREATSFSEQQEAESLRILARADGGVSAQRARDVARTRLVEGYQPLILAMARRYVRRCRLLSVSDLTQEGIVGLLEAIARHDGREDATGFRSWARIWIRSAILTAIWRNEYPLSVPIHKMKALVRLKRAQSDLLVELEREPTAEELAGRLTCTVKAVRDLQVLAALRAVSLDVPVDEDLGERSLADTIAAPSASVTAREHSHIERLVSHLSARQRDVILLRYGFHDGHAYSVAEVAKRLNLSAERVEELDRQARIRLRSWLDVRCREAA